MPVADFEYDGTSVELINDLSAAYDAMDLLERCGAPIMLVPITSDVLLCGGNWHGRGIWQLVREGHEWMPGGEVEFFLRATTSGGFENADR
ncbi:MAG: hypothetical protein EPN75_05570 [Beijerinckiaceae bacterium]|nr:MAG: hypothetical protein EPN75_05570 [Beijerinckiaceae bacterium]